MGLSGILPVTCDPICASFIYKTEATDVFSKSSGHSDKIKTAHGLMSLKGSANN